MSIMNNHITVCPIVGGKSWYYTYVLQVCNAHASAHNFTCTIHFDSVCIWSFTCPFPLNPTETWLWHSTLLNDVELLNCYAFILIITGDMWNMFWKLPSWHDECCRMWSSFLQYMLERFVNLGLNIYLYPNVWISAHVNWISLHIISNHWSMAIAVLSGS